MRVDLGGEPWRIVRHHRRRGAVLRHLQQIGQAHGADRDRSGQCNVHPCQGEQWCADGKRVAE